MNKVVLALALAASASAFVPAQVRLAATALRSTIEEEAPVIDEIVAEPTAARLAGDRDAAADAELKSAPIPTTSVNGWAPDQSKFCYGLPGSLLPVREFDPLGFAQGSCNDIKLYREAEVQHGRVAMLATVGYLVGEAVPWGPSGPANDQLAQLPVPVVAAMGAAIGFTEWGRANTGWVEPWNGVWKIRDSYYPGDTGFDPLGMKPTDPKEFEDMATKELQNGRLAMLGAAGMCGQELINHKTIFQTVSYYQNIYSGGDALVNADYMAATQVAPALSEAAAPAWVAEAAAPAVQAVAEPIAQAVQAVADAAPAVQAVAEPIAQAVQAVAEAAP